MKRTGRLRRALLIGLAGMVSLALAGAVPSSAEAHTKRPAVPVLRWQSCGSDFPHLLCTTATVPLDYDRPHGRTTRLALAKRPATDSAHRIGTVFVNPGGPGGSGVNMVKFGFGDYLGDRLKGRFDVVGFDPRGVAASTPLHCFASQAALEEFFVDQPIFPYEKKQQRPFFRQFRSLAGECLDDRRSVARHMSTADVARDMDLLRRAVGDAKLTYLGFSYGSYLGNTYANLFPDRVRALAIDGVLDPRLWSSGWQIVSDRVATQKVFEEFLRLCDAAREDCAFYRPGGSAARWSALADALRREPLILDSLTYSYDVLIADAARTMYAPEVWTDYALLLDYVALVVLTEKSGTGALVTQRSELLRRLAGTTPEPNYPNFVDAYYGNQCADTAYPRRFATYRSVAAYAERGSPFGPYWWWRNAGCADWPTARDRYTGPWTAKTSAPVLVIGNRFDPATDLAGARATDRLLRNSRLLTYAGSGHTAYGRTECVTDYIDDYLLTRTLPPVGTICPANPSPFLDAGARASKKRPVLVGLPTLPR